MQKIYQSRDWLYTQYWTKMLNPRQIGESVGVCQTTIWNWLYKLNIPVRSIGEARHLVKGNHCNLSQEAKEWSDGELLGDGGIYSRNSYSAYFQYTSQYNKYAQYISDTLKSFGIEQTGEIREYPKNEKYSYYYISRSYEELLPIRKRWYPESKKIVPRDLKLTPLVCRQWYIGDGYLHHRKGGKPSITLYTNAFPVGDVEWLVEKLKEFGFKSTRNPSNNTIAISAYSTKAFLDYIGPCPVKEYEYKWDYDKKIVYNEQEFKERYREYYQKHKEEKREYNKRYHQDHKKECREHQKWYRQEHREEIREYGKQYRQEHKEERREYDKQYYQKRRERCKEYNINEVVSLV